MLPGNRSRASHARLVTWIALASLAVLTLAALSASATSHHGIEPEFRIGQDTTNPDRPYEAFDAVTIAAVDLTGDGVKEIIAHNDNNRAYIFDGSNGNLLAELQTNHPDGWQARELAGPAVGDVTGNGVTDIVFTNSAAWVTAFEVRPTDDHRKIEVTKLWETFLDPNEQDPNRDWEYPGLDAPAFLADTNNDGRDEVFAQLDDQPSVFKLNPDGHVEHWNDHSDGNGGPLVGDVSNNGALEAVVPSDGGQITIYDASSMGWRCQFDAKAHGVWPGSISVSPTLADVTSDGRLEIIFGVRNVEEEQYEGWEDESDAHYFAVNADCHVVWHKTWEWSNPHVHMHPAPVDVTGDGSLDIVFQDWNTVGHKPGNWEHTGPSNLFAVDGHTGDLLWRAELPNYWSNKNVAIADATGDGHLDVLANEVDHGDGIGLYDLAGNKKGFVAGPNGWVVSKGPTVTDLDGDDRLEVILPVHRDSDHCDRNRDVGCREGSLQVYSTPSYATPVYSNNHMLNADDAAAEPPDDAAPPPDDGGDEATGDFDASFENVRGNEWWIETDVNANEPVASVHARVDGGSWFDLQKQDWGSWATSQHAPEGAIVEFQARNSDGDRALSGCYAWGEDPSSTTCPDGSGGSGDDGGDEATGDFDASFENVRGNEWWIETDIHSDRSISSAEVRLDGGSWASLEKQDWGSWARSEHAPDGTVVQFQAHSGSETAMSSCYAWGEDPTTTSCPDGSGSGGDDGGDSGGAFEASFIEPRGNEWWIEVDVDSSDTVVSVDARTEDGSWFGLETTDWGSWARNTHVGEDTQVQFRATNDAGDTAHSDWVPWPP